MPDLDFETRFTGQLREYAHRDIPPIDALAVAEATIATGRTRAGVRWPSVLGRGWPVPVLLSLLLLVLAVAVGVVGSRLLAPPPVIAPPRAYQGVLVPAPDLITPLGYPKVVTLADGRVLIVDDSGATKPISPEVFDPTTGRQTPTGPMVTDEPLGAGTIIRLRDGRVLLIGSTAPLSGPSRAVAQVFDPATLRFTAVGPMVTPRAGAKLAMLADGRVLVTGGAPPNDGNTTLASAEILDPSTGAFTATGSMRTSRSGHAVVSLPDGRVLVIGGETASGGGGEGLSSAEVYDPTTGRFNDAGSMSTIAAADLAITLPDGRVLVFGWGETDLDASAGATESWDPLTNTFSVAPGPPRHVGTATLLDDGRVLLTGEGNGAASWAGMYDPATGRTREIQAPRSSDAVATRLADGRVLLVGGHGNHQAANPGPWLATMEFFQ